MLTTCLLTDVVNKFEQIQGGGSRGWNGVSLSEQVWTFGRGVRVRIPWDLWLTNGIMGMKTLHSRNYVEDWNKK